MILKIKELREEQNLTQAELAAKIKNVQRNISNWENGNSEPDCQSILALANAFGVSLDRLFGRTMTRESNDQNSEILRELNHLTPEQKQALINFIKIVVKDKTE